MIDPNEFQQIIDAHKYFVQLRYEHWMQYEVYTGMWWLLLCAWILPWIVWLFLVKRQQITELFCYGITVMFTITILDEIGLMKGLWTYSIKIIPYTPYLESIDWGILPVVYMLIYQYFPDWNGFIIAQITLAALYSFVGEPFLKENLEVYLLLDWKYIYSFPIYIILAIMPKVVIKALYHIERKSKMDEENSR